MAITLQQLSITTGDKIKAAAIESLLKEYYLLSQLTFDDSVTPSKDAALNYVYSRIIKASGAGTRNINENFESSAAELEKVVATLKPLGGVYSLDNAVKGANNAASIVEFQQNQKIKAAVKALFDNLINGTDATAGFDGVKTLLATEKFAKQVITTNLDTSAVLSRDDAKALLSLMDELVSKAKLKNGNGIIVANSKTLLKLKAAAREVGYLSQTENAFGVTADFYNGVALIDLEDANGEDIIPVDEEEGTTSIYGIRLGLDAVHPAAALTSEELFTVLPPNFEAAAANGNSVASGLVQLVTAFAFETLDCIAGIEGLKVQ